VEFVLAALTQITRLGNDPLPPGWYNINPPEATLEARKIAFTRSK